MKSAQRLPIGVKLVLAGTLFVTAVGYYAFQVLYPSLFNQLNLDARTVTTLALIPIAAGIATLFVPAFITSRRRRLLAVFGLVVAFAASGFLRWIGNGLFVTDGYEELGLFLIRYAFFTPTYAFLFVLGWIVFALLDYASGRRASDRTHLD